MSSRQPATSLSRLEAENTRLRRAVEELSVINEVATAVSSASSLETIIDLVVQKCVKHLAVAQGAVLIFGDQEHRAALRTMVRKVEAESSTDPFRLSEQVIARLFKNQALLVINDAENDKHFPQPTQTADGSVKSLLCAPLRLHGKMIGVLSVFNKRSAEGFTQSDKRLIKIIAAQSAQVIENARLYEEEKAREKRTRFIRQTFGRYLSDDIVESILETPAGLELGGEERKVTIMMTDIRGFSALAERLPPQDVVSMLNIYLETMTDIIVKHKGTIDEFIGDAILVIFGAPLACGGEGKRAVACAVEMQLAMDKVNARFREAGFPEIGMGIGLRTGEVIVGNIGSSKRSKYGVVGRNVNLASRIESYSLAGQILACEGTLQECGAILRIDGEMEVVPKGVDKPITIYEIGGIGGDCNVFLPKKREIEFEELDDRLPAEFSVLAGKDADSEVHHCEVMAVSSSGARLRSADLLPELRENLKLTLRDRSGTPLSDAIYAKVWEHTSKKPRTFVARFTSVPPATGSFLETVIAENRRR